MADFNTVMTVKGTKEDLEKVTKVLMKWVEKQAQYVEERNCAYFDDFRMSKINSTEIAEYSMNADGSFSNEEAIQDFIANAGNEVCIYMSGPYGCFGLLDEDITLFEEMAEVAPNATFSGEMSGFNPGGDQTKQGTLKNKMLYIYVIEDMDEHCEYSYKYDPIKCRVKQEPKTRTKISEYISFHGTLVRGPKAVVDKYIEEKLKNIHIIEKKDIGSDEVLLRINCEGRQIACQKGICKELAIATFASFGPAIGNLYIKRPGKTVLEEYELGEIEGLDYNSQFYNVCPDKKFHERIYLCDDDEAVELKYEPSEYVISIVSDDKIKTKADAEPVASFDYIEEYEEDLIEKGYISYDCAD